MSIEMKRIRGKKPFLLLSPVNPKSSEDRIYAKVLREAGIPYEYAEYTSPAGLSLTGLVVAKEDRIKAAKEIDSVMGTDMAEHLGSVPERRMKNNRAIDYV